MRVGERQRRKKQRRSCFLLHFLKLYQTAKKEKKHMESFKQTSKDKVKQICFEELIETKSNFEWGLEQHHHPHTAKRPFIYNSLIYKKARAEAMKKKEVGESLILGVLYLWPLISVHG